jgi:hypothetical protein
MLSKKEDFWELSVKVNPDENKELYVHIKVFEVMTKEYEIQFRKTESLEDGTRKITEKLKGYDINRLQVDEIMDFLFDEGFQKGHMEYDVISYDSTNEEDFAFFIRNTLDNMLYEFRRIANKFKLTMSIEVLDSEEVERRVSRIVCMKEVYEFILKHPRYAGICVAESKTGDNYNRAYLVPEEEIPALQRILEHVHTRPYKYGIIIDDEKEIDEVNDKFYELDEQKRIFEISEWETSLRFGFSSCKKFEESLRTGLHKK